MVDKCTSTVRLSGSGSSFDRPYHWSCIEDPGIVGWLMTEDDLLNLDSIAIVYCASQYNTKHSFSEIILLGVVSL